MKLGCFIPQTRELRNGKLYQTSIERIMSNRGSLEEIANGDSSENVERQIPEIQTHLISQSFAQGVLPDIRRKAKVIPVPKHGSKLDVHIYRPISFLRVDSKVFERVKQKTLLTLRKI